LQPVFTVEESDLQNDLVGQLGQTRACASGDVTSSQEEDEMEPEKPASHALAMPISELLAITCSNATAAHEVHENDAHVTIDSFSDTEEARWVSVLVLVLVPVLVPVNPALSWSNSVLVLGPDPGPGQVLVPVLVPMSLSQSPPMSRSRPQAKPSPT